MTALPYWAKQHLSQQHLGRSLLIVLYVEFPALDLATGYPGEVLPHQSWLKPVLVLVGSSSPTEVLTALGGVQSEAQLLQP